MLRAIDDCQLAIDVRTRVRQMRSADTRTLAVNRTSSSFGDRTFAIVGQLSARPETTETVVRPVQAVIWTVMRPRRSVNSFNCAV